MKHAEWCRCDACMAEARREIERGIQDIERMDDPRAALAAQTLRDMWRKLREQAKEQDNAR